jgi:GNAT superfamily N-acetyltransferase
MSMSHEGFELDFFDSSIASEELWQQSADLMLGAFGWPISVMRLVQITHADPRFSEDPIGACATDGDGVLVGYVGMGRRTLVDRGEEVPTGHIWSFAVRRDHTRKGVGGALIRMAMERFREEGLENITLYSSTALVAYGMYRALHFRDHHRLVYRMAPRARRGGPAPVRRLEPDELAGLTDLYNRNLGTLEGFSRREGDIHQLYGLWAGIGRDSYVTIDPEGSLEGYLMVAPEPVRGLTVVTEVVGPDHDWYRQALHAARWLDIGDQVLAGHRNPAAFEAFELEDFKWHDVRSHELMMAVGPDIIEEDEGWMADPGWFLESRLDVF